MLRRIGRIAVSSLIWVGYISAARADQVQYLAYGDQALARFVETARSATKTLDIANFIFEPCHPSTQVFLQVLEERIKAGVHVRVLLDAVSQSQAQKRNLIDYFTQIGAEIRIYNDFSVYNPLMNLRMHAKVTIADGERYITGGRNYSDEYFGLSATQNWVDSDIYVRGSSANQAEAAFNELWNSSMVSAGRADGAGQDWDSFCGLDHARIAKIENYLTTKGLLTKTPTQTCDRVRFVVDNPEFANPAYGSDSNDPVDSYMNPARMRLKRATRAALGFMAASKTRLRVLNYIYIPYGYLDQTLSDLRARDLPVSIITNLDMDAAPTPAFLRQAEEYLINHFATQDSTGSQWVHQISAREALSDANPLSVPGVSFLIHAKTMVRDERDTVVGSFNLDPRSYSTNVEDVVIVKSCPAFAKDAQVIFDRLSGVYDRDAANGALPPMETPSPAAIALAWTNMIEF